MIIRNWIAAFAAGLIASAAGAQASGETQPPGGSGQGQTRAQAAQRADQAFQRLDLNHDGSLTQDEARQAAAAFMAQRGGGDDSRIQARIERMFAGAPSLTQQQYEQEALARFDRQDSDHDGVVTADEREQARAGRQ